MTLHCPPCGPDTTHAVDLSSKHSQLAALAGGFFSLSLFIVGVFTLGLAWIAAVFFFLLFLYWGIGTNKFWRCTVCASLLPRGM